jgi:virginiamycin B lyase
MARHRSVAVVSLVVVSALWLAPQAAADLYWTDNQGPGPGTIARSGLDGTGVDQRFITAVRDPEGVAVYGSHIYWTSARNTGPGWIGRANLNGTGVDRRFITVTFATVAIAVNRHGIYWTQFNGTIGRASLNGRHVDQHLVRGLANPDGVAVQGSHIYWTASTKIGAGAAAVIGRAGLSGRNVNRRFIGDAGGRGVVFSGIAANARSLYWGAITTHGIGWIGRASLNGTHVEKRFLVPRSAWPEGIALSSAEIFWGNGGPQQHAIGRVTLDGRNADSTFIPLPGSVTPLGVAVS